MIILKCQRSLLFLDPSEGRKDHRKRSSWLLGRKEDVEEPRMPLAAVPTAFPLVLPYKSLIIPSVSLGVFSVYLSLEPRLCGPIWSLTCRLTCPRHGAGQSGSRCWGRCVPQCVACNCPQGLRKDAHIEVTVSEALISMCLNSILLVFFLKKKITTKLFLLRRISQWWQPHLGRGGTVLSGTSFIIGWICQMDCMTYGL